MKTKRIGFWVGLAAAAVFSLVSANIDSLLAAAKAHRLANDPELRLAREAGLVDAEQLTPRWLSARIQRGEFAQLLRSVLEHLGHPAGRDLASLRESALFAPAPARRTLTRRDAIEALLRCENSIAKLEWVAPTPLAPIQFSDYTPPSSLRTALSRLIDLRVVRGYAEDRVAPNRSLSNREALMFIWRFYEATSARMAEKRAQTNGVPLFIDIPFEHPAQADLAALSRAGVLLGVNLGPSFDGNRTLTVAHACALVGNLWRLTNGIPEGGKSAGEGSTALARAQDTKLWDPQALGAGTGDAPLRRREAAIMLATILRKVAGDGPGEGSAAATHAYVDLAAGTRDADALSTLARHGIIIGYPDGRFAGDEEVTRFEMLGLLKAALRIVQKNVADAPDDNLPAGLQTYPRRDQLVKMAERIHERCLRAKAILHRERPPLLSPLPPIGSVATAPSWLQPPTAPSVAGGSSTRALAGAR